MLGDRLKKEREKRGWTKKYAADRLGLKQMSTYANYEYGLRDPDTEMLVKLASLYETSTDYLMGSVDDPQHRDAISELHEDINIKTTEDILKKI
ncbi:helix-turn-helix domain-containing protein [Cohnella ginsengisoli]|uniref:Helix-turn-helix domain-containing protein n=1 Tax=Cohnella ginsengisoli TaxID=425004 RepID=A0A9X4KHA3_9BACL|nr:helix-turn-helix transcriptional regulator [Cohnella ginsengisoli]MDG0791965.1 helix-turn-helix domain-containing protein [Cohnella ginsengisoli]